MQRREKGLVKQKYKIKKNLPLIPEVVEESDQSKDSLDSFEKDDVEVETSDDESLDNQELVDIDYNELVD